MRAGIKAGVRAGAGKEGSDNVLCVRMGSPGSQSGVGLEASRGGRVLMSITFELWPSSRKCPPFRGLPLDGVLCAPCVV